MTRFAFVGLFCLMLLGFFAPHTQAQAGYVNAWVVTQNFERGLMMWRSDTGLIWVLADDGAVLTYPVSSFSRLRDNPIKRVSATGDRAINGFGKVWGNRASVRRLIGWPTSGENGLAMKILTVNDGSTLIDTHGFIYNITLHSWAVTYSAHPPTPVQPVPAILSFSAGPNPISPGTLVSFQWEAVGVEVVVLEFYDTTTGLLISTIEELPIKGSATYAVPTNTASSIRVILIAANRTYRYWERPNQKYQGLANAEITLTLQGGGATYTSTTAVAFQGFENGSMLWRADTGTVYVFGPTRFIFEQAQYGVWPDNPPADVPVGFFNPINAFGKVWASSSTIQQSLGRAVTPEQGYEATLTYRSSDGRLLSITNPAGGPITLP